MVCKYTKKKFFAINIFKSKNYLTHQILKNKDDKKIIEENAEEGEERNTLSNEKGFEQENNINKKVKNMERKLESNHKNHNTNNRKINESHRSSSNYINNLLLLL